MCADRVEEPAPDPTSERRRETFARFLGYVRPYWRYILLAVIGGVGKFTIPLLMPKLTQFLIDDVFTNHSMPSEEKLRTLYLLTGGMMALFVFVWAPACYIRHYYAPRAGQRSVFDLRCDLYRRLMRMSASFFDRNKTGSILSRLTSDVSLAQNLVGNALTNVWMDTAAVFVVLSMMLSIDVRATLVALATMPFYLVFFKFIRGHLKETTRQVQDELANLAGNAQERLAGSTVVHAFAQEENEDRRFLDDCERHFSVSMRRVFWQCLNSTCVGGVTHLAPLAVILYTGYRVVAGSDMSVGDLIALNMYLGPLYLPIRRFSELNVVFANATAALDRIFEFMDEDPEVRSRGSAVDVDRLVGLVEFEDVWFSYGQAEEKAPRVLRGISCRVEPGENVALVGPSGSGKSTFAALIPRFYDVDHGCIRIDGRDVRDYDVRSLRGSIGVVLQDPMLFSGAIRENVLYGKPGSSEEAVLEALDAANALEFVNRLPDGVETEVGEQGVLLSGGQKQRLTIARAFLSDPRILILDEATSSLDSETERLIQKAIDRLIQGRTSFTIAHRLSTILHADRIFVLDSGRIVDSGAHEELLDKSDIYRNLYEQQFWGVLEGVGKPPI